MRVSLDPSSRPSLPAECRIFPLTRLMLVVAWLWSIAATQAPAAPPEYAVGVARLEITPDYPVRLSGFGFRRQESEGVRQALWAKALAIGADDEQPAILITIDNLGISDDVTRALAQRLQKRARIAPERLAVTATHTHTAPMLTGVVPTLFSVPIPPDHQAHIDRYTHELLDRLEQVAVAALADRQPARLEWGIGRAGFAINRRTKGGPVDHDLPLLVVRTSEGKVRALYVNYACHAVTLSDNRISGDWPGYAQEHLERMHPGATALISVGCGADSNPSSGVTGDKAEVASQQGVEIASEVDRLLQGTLRAVSGPLVTNMERIDLALNKHPTRAEFEERGKKADYVGYHARVQLERLDRGEPLLTKISYPIQSWSFGDSLAIVFLPGEVVVDYALRLKKELDGKRLWINAYANDAPCYIPSERILREGGYEGADAMTYYDKPAAFAPGLEQPIINVVHKQIGETFARPAGEKREQAHGPEPLSPQDSLATLRTGPGLTVQLMAAEPLVASPVAIDFGPDGKLWVAEMYDYPQGLDGNYQPGGRVRLLTSSTDDGRFDRATVFLEGIPFPTGVTVWRQGVLVCAAPDILYAEDTDGDGRADVVKKLYSGFGTENYQGRVNSLEYGLDGWVYGSCGLFGGRISRFSGEEPYPLGDRDFRIRPDTGEIEPATGRTQQGRVRDDWGNWFGCANSTLCLHYPLADHYLRRNSAVASPPSGVLVPGGNDPQRLFPAKPDVQTFKLSGPSGRPTAACGLGIYRDTLLGPDYAGNAFTCEPVNLLVHRRRLHGQGMTFTGLRAAEELEREFLASTDNWFRPVQVRTGPDGGLWVVDMYRQVIEHPRWIPAEEVARLDVRAGFDRGRLYRVLPSGSQGRPWPRLDRQSPTELVAALESDNGWQRDMASQLLIWRKETGAAPALEKLAARSPLPGARLHALCVLESLQQIRSPTVAAALRDSHPGVRRHAVRIAEKLLPISPELGKGLLALTADDDPQVRLQLACTLGEWHDPAAAQGLAQLALREPDLYLEAAVLSSLRTDNVAEVVTRVLAGAADGRPSEALQQQLLSVAASLADAATLPQILERVAGDSPKRLAPWQWKGLAGVLDALERRSKGADGSTRPAIPLSLERVLEEARRIAVDEQSPEELLAAAIPILGRDAKQAESDLPVLAALLTPRHSAPTQYAAANALARIAGPQAIDKLLAGWAGYSPTFKRQILELVLGRNDGTTPLLGELAAGRIPPSDIDATFRQRLLTHRQRTVREQAEQLFAGSNNPDRRQVLEKYQSALALDGDRARGKAV
ncbi:MAG: neutral/alkaline non-lysosomal ceramidase N-terminal domain-containing protein, partial [Planctomycetales bacterium]